MPKKTPTKRIIPEEKIMRTLVVCFNRSMIEEAMRKYMQDLRDRGIKYEYGNNIVIYKHGRMFSVRKMFLTPEEERRVIGRRYNEVQFYDRAREHPKFEDFMQEIEPYRIMRLFDEGEEVSE